MARQQHKTQKVENESGYALQQQITIDDSLLPPAEELYKLKQIDNSIIEWIKERTEIEQNARIKFNFDSIEIVKIDQNIAKTSLWLAFAIAFLAMVTSIVFMYIGKEIAGGAFGFISVVMYVQAFLKFGRNQKQS
jgi:hypothetical protein